MAKPNPKNRADIPDVRADEPEHAMDQFTAGLRRVLAAHKPRQPRKKRVKARAPS